MALWVVARTIPLLRRGKVGCICSPTAIWYSSGVSLVEATLEKPLFQIGKSVIWKATYFFLWFLFVRSLGVVGDDGSVSVCDNDVVESFDSSGSRGVTGIDQAGSIFFTQNFVSRALLNRNAKAVTACAETCRTVISSLVTVGVLRSTCDAVTNCWQQMVSQKSTYFFRKLMKRSWQTYLALWG